MLILKNNQSMYTNGACHQFNVCGAVSAYPSGASDFTSVFHRGSCSPVICVFFFHVIVLSFGV